MHIALGYNNGKSCIFVYHFFYCVSVYPIEQQSTDLLIKYFDKLVTDNILQVEHVRNLAEHNTLQNPILELEAHANSKLLAAHKQINIMLAHIMKLQQEGKSVIEYAAIKNWAKEKLEALGLSAQVQQEVREETREVDRQMRFLNIPAGTYVSEIDGSTFEIPSGVEIQETEVTQHQWNKIMGANPSYYGGLDTEYPMEHIGFVHIQEFIEKLNTQDSQHEYMLPSLHEYEAILHVAVGAHWRDIVHGHLSAGHDSPTAVTSLAYLERDNERVWGIIGNVWEFTRDNLILDDDVNEESAHLVFGGSYNTTPEACNGINSLIRPVLYSGAKHKSVGFRLVRRRKNVNPTFNTTFSKILYFISQIVDTKKVDTYYQYQFNWNEKHIQQDNAWVANKPNECLIGCNTIDLDSPETKKTIGYALKQREGNVHAPWWDIYSNTAGSDLSPLKKIIELSHLSMRGIDVDLATLATLSHLTSLCFAHTRTKNINFIKNLRNLEYLDLSYNDIEDIAPIAHLHYLKRVDLRSNLIKDISPLGKLPNLEQVFLQNNYIQNYDALCATSRLQHVLMFPGEWYSEDWQGKGYWQAHADRLTACKPHIFIN